MQFDYRYAYYNLKLYIQNSQRLQSTKVISTQVDYKNFLKKKTYLLIFSKHENSFSIN